MVDGSRHSLQATGWALNEAVAWPGSFTVLSVDDEGADNGLFHAIGGMAVAPARSGMVPDGEGGSWARR